MAERSPAAPKTYGVRVLVSNFARSWKFYRDGLGLPPVTGHGEPPYGEFSAGNGTVIGLFDRRLMAKAVGLEGRVASARSVGRSALILSVPDVDAFARRLTRRRVKLLRPPTDRPDWGLRTIHVRDPDGYLIEIYSRLRTTTRAR